MPQGSPVVAIIGGTGTLGSGLTVRRAAAGYAIVIGSRDEARAKAAARRATRRRGAPPARAMPNRAAAAAADVVVLTVPWTSHAQILVEIRPHVAGKIVVETTVPLVPPKVARVQLPAETSAALAAQGRLGEMARVVAAFHNVAAHKLQGNHPIDCDVLVFGDDGQDRAMVVALAERPNCAACMRVRSSMRWRAAPPCGFRRRSYCRHFSRPWGSLAATPVFRQ